MSYVVCVLQVWTWIWRTARANNPYRFGTSFHVVRAFLLSGAKILCLPWWRVSSQFALFGLRARTLWFLATLLLFLWSLGCAQLKPFEKDFWKWFPRHPGGGGVRITSSTAVLNKNYIIFFRAPRTKSQIESERKRFMKNMSNKVPSDNDRIPPDFPNHSSWIYRYIPIFVLRIRGSGSDIKQQAQTIGP